MNIALAGIGWINDSLPHGNRLRWNYPFTQVIGGDHYLGWPEKFFIERTPVNEDLWQPPDVKAGDGTLVSGAWMAYPQSWWSAPVDHWFTDVFTFLRLPTPVHAISFTYIGPPTLMRIKDLTNQRLLLERQIVNNEFVFFAGGCIQEIKFLGPTGLINMKDFSYLDLFANRPGNWELIAEIDVKAPLEKAAGLAGLAARSGAPLLIGDPEWNELLDLVHKTQAASPLTDPALVIDKSQKNPAASADVQSPWQALELVLGLRWQFACLLGFGFHDGPGQDFCKFDNIQTGLLLQHPPAKPVAYRVSCDDLRVGASNLVVCPPYPAGKLPAPASPSYIQPEVRLKLDGTMEASMRMDWIQHDFNAIGAEVEETLGASKAMKSDAETRRFECRTPDPSSPLLSGWMERRFTVAWHDVTLSAKARALDGWDRLSPFSAPTGPVDLKLCHEPYPPNLLSAKYVQGVTSLELDPDWQPDAIVSAANGNVFIYRRDPNQPLKTAAITVEKPVPDGSAYQAGYIAPSGFNPQDFALGSLVVGKTRLEVGEISANTITFFLPPDSNGTITAYQPGQATLYQNQKDDSLWVKLDELPVAGLPTVVKVNEPLPFPTGKADVLQYSARLSFLKRLGPFGNIASDFRIPKAPPVPPPFTVELQGVDFYGRTLVKLTLTKAAKSEDRFRVWWAMGDYSAPGNTDFSGEAVAGLYDAQAALNGLVLFDLLPLPIDPDTHVLLSAITIGLQQVNESGGQSKFERVKIQ